MLGAAVEGEKGDVVEGGGVAGVGFDGLVDGVEQGFGEVGGRLCLDGVDDEIAQAVVAEEGAVGVVGFGDAVGVGAEEAAAWQVDGFDVVGRGVD